ncbi:hypothetical protein BYZ73_13210 [Rhodovulum viride]|uniref:Uncharacterized protein n=1 Tax=Rhodovulum viride TaxID=1231134 RepID=A0ABX9DHE3_9RHOB|nr:hypothetical protein [Rhodovulum viride]RAP40728.1 hypothetical protein BYZ73_13210 [Rhodovulum viride]
MDGEEHDSADFLVTAARKASGEGMTREQFIAAAGFFWDSWHKGRDFMSDFFKQGNREDV